MCVTVVTPTATPRLPTRHFIYIHVRMFDACMHPPCMAALTHPPFMAALTHPPCMAALTQVSEAVEEAGSKERDLRSAREAAEREAMAQRAVAAAREDQAAAEQRAEKVTSLRARGRLFITRGGGAGEKRHDCE